VSLRRNLFHCNYLYLFSKCIILIMWTILWQRATLSKLCIYRAGYLYWTLIKINKTVAITMAKACCTFWNQTETKQWNSLRNSFRIISACFIHSWKIIVLTRLKVFQAVSVFCFRMSDSLMRQRTVKPTIKYVTDLQYITSCMADVINASAVRHMRF